MPRNDKPWLQAIPKAISYFNKTGKQPVIISNDLDGRFGYYANTKALYELKVQQNWTMYHSERRGEYDNLVPKYLKSSAEFEKKIDSFGRERCFIIWRAGRKGYIIDDQILQKSFPNIKLLGVFKDKKKRVFKLYQL